MKSIFISYIIRAQQVTPHKLTDIVIKAANRERHNATQLKQIILNIRRVAASLVWIISTGVEVT